MAKPVGVVESDGRVIVVCDDGSLYRCEDAFHVAPEAARWETMPPVPNTDIQDQLQRAERQEGGGLQWLPPPNASAQSAASQPVAPPGERTSRNSP